MTFKSIFLAVFVTSTILLSPISKSMAGPYTDALSKCIIDSTTSSDREDLITWMFSAISLHPVVKGMSKISQDQMDNSSKTTARMFERLMAEDCVKQTKEAVQYEGAIAIESSFNLLGQVAAKEIFQHQNVATAIADLEKYFDTTKLEENLKRVE